MTVRTTIRRAWPRCKENLPARWKAEGPRSTGGAGSCRRERAFRDCRRLSFVAREHGFSSATIEAGRPVLSETVARRPMRGYPDLPVLRDLPVKRFLVTTGFRRLQESKVEALGVRTGLACHGGSSHEPASAVPTDRDR